MVKGPKARMVEARGSNPLRSTPKRARGLVWIRHWPSIFETASLDKPFKVSKPVIAGSNPAESALLYIYFIRGLGYMFELCNTTILS